MANQATNIVDFAKAKELQAQTKTDPKDPQGPNWLKRLPKGTIFLTRQKPAKGFELVVCEVLAQTEKSTKLLNTAMDDVQVKVVVDSAMFSVMMELVETLGFNAGPDKKEQEDGNSDRPEQA